MLTIYKPALDDLWFKQEMLEDRKTMQYNHAWGGCIPFPRKDWPDWYDYWIINNENKRYYRYLVNDGKFIGEIAYHYNNEEGHYLADIIIHAKYRGCGYGKEGLKILCEEAKKNGIKVLYDDIAIDNTAIKIFIDCGFSIEYKTVDKIYLKKVL